ncbi:MAG: translesion DNA synthesis-associated protein ImuA [Pseudomonadales bacterium]|nr:translesion DNA synthesis-associated protein ImuA [Pseudomonadales bacterium]
MATPSSAFREPSVQSELPARSLQTLLEHPALWRAGQLQRAPAAHPSGFPELDAHLPGGGWPRAGLAECLLDTTGVGELRVLAPLIRALSRSEARWIAWINPPFTPYAPALAALDIDLERMLVISPRTHREAVWALEQTSRSGSCSLALAWLDERQLGPRDTRRLQFAAQQGQMLTCLFRPAQAAATQSMAELRLALAPAGPGRLRIDIRKRRGSWPVSGIEVQVETPDSPEAVYVQLDHWRRQRAAAVTDAVTDAKEPADLAPVDTATALDASPGVSNSPVDAVAPVTH